MCGNFIDESSKTKVEDFLNKHKNFELNFEHTYSLPTQTVGILNDGHKSYKSRSSTDINDIYNDIWSKIQHL